MAARRDRARRPRVDGKRLLEKRGLPDLARAQRTMIERLRGAGGISARALAAMAEVPRHAFAPPHLSHLAHADVELWGPSAFLARPSAVARLATAVGAKRARRVLEEGTGVGYVTAVLALVAEHVDTVGRSPWQLWPSSDAFRELGLKNVSQKAGDGRLGWPERAPYDAIVVSAALPRIPRALIGQLTDTGVCIVPVGAYPGPQRLLMARRSADGITVSELGRHHFPPLAGAWSAADLWWRPPPVGEHGTGRLGTGFWPAPGGARATPAG